MPVDVIPILYEDIPGAVTCIQEAFRGDPYNEWVFDQTSFSADRNRASLTARCEWGIRNARFYVAKDRTSNDPSEVLGVAMWMPPKPLSEPESWNSFFDTWLLWFKQALINLRYGGRGGLRVNRYNIWKRKQAEMQEEIWTDEGGYYFCNIVTVLPKAQGRGIGRKLFEVVTREADNEGKRCYLESSKMDPNVRIYERMGWRLVKEMICEDEGEACNKALLYDSRSVTSKPAMNVIACRQSANVSISIRRELKR